MLSAVQKHLALPTLQVLVFSTSLSKSGYTQDAVPARPGSTFSQVKRQILTRQGDKSVSQQKLQLLHS